MPLSEKSHGSSNSPGSRTKIACLFLWTRRECILRGFHFDVEDGNAPFWLPPTGKSEETRQDYRVMNMPDAENGQEPISPNRPGGPG